MGLLDDAIRQHLELKRQHGASSEELAEKEAEAFGPARRERVAPDDLPAAEEVLEEPPLAAEPVPAEEPLLEEEPLPEEEPPVAEPPPLEPVAEEPTQLMEPEPAEPEPYLEPEPDEPESLLEPEPDEPEPRAAEAAAGAPESDLLEPLPEPPLAPEAEPPQEAPRRGDTPAYGVPAVEPDPADEIFAEEPAEPAPEEEEEDEDVLEETPDFLQETPEHDRLWFEQKPPRDFDFDDD